MEKVIYDEKNGLWYELQGDYYIPCFYLPAVKTAGNVIITLKFVPKTVLFIINNLFHNHISLKITLNFFCFAPMIFISTSSTASVYLPSTISLFLNWFKLSITKRRS